MKRLSCRFCRAPLRTSFCDLGSTPLANSYLTAAQLDQPEAFYPLHAYVCDECFLVQLDHVEAPENIFSEYAYFSSYSTTWLEHCKRYVTDVVQRFSLTGNSQVVEVASNDGYLLRYFAERSIPVLGIEPARNVAAAATRASIPTLVRFFDESLAAELLAEGKTADLLIANNVLAHVPNLNGFVAGLARLLAARGVLTLEFPHLLQLIRNNQFDTIYHEHFSYFSLHSVESVLRHHGLVVFDVQELPTHGGSLRVFARNAADETKPVQQSVNDLRCREMAEHMTTLAAYQAFDERVRGVKRALLHFLLDAVQGGKRVVGYGAPAKGNTLLNVCGIRRDLLPYTADLSPHKQGLYLPGTRLPIVSPDTILNDKPDYVLVLPWNVREEVQSQLQEVRRWGGQFVTAIPTLQFHR